MSLLVYEKAVRYIRFCYGEKIYTRVTWVYASLRSYYDQEWQVTVNIPWNEHIGLILRVVL
jgi:hypothetical protein